MERDTHEIAIEMSDFEDIGKLETPIRSCHVIASSQEESPEKSSATERPQCRICLEQEMELQTDPILRLGCNCIGELGQAHKSCIEEWFGRQLNRGRVTCEICNSVLRMSIFSIVADYSIQLRIHEAASSLQVNYPNETEAIVWVRSSLPAFHVDRIDPQAPLSEGNINDSEESGQRRILKCFQVLTGVLVVAVTYTLIFRFN